MSKQQGIRLRRFYTTVVRGRSDIAEIAREARSFAEAPYAADGYPANLHAISLRILTQARYCLALIDSKDAELAVAAGYELGHLCESANKIMAAWTALEQKRIERQQKIIAADAKNAPMNEKKKKVIERWLASAPHRYGDKKRFSYSQSEVMGVSQKTVYEEWLSKKSIEEFKV